MKKLPAVLALGVALMGGCADDPSPRAGPADPWTPAPGTPTHAELTCAEDGSVTLSSETVQPRPDGVHLRVVNRFDETVSVAGFDADPGTTKWVFTQGPGTMELMCWPFSQHTSGDEPPRFPLEIVDPAGLFFDGAVDCEIEMHTTADYVEEPVDHGPPPLRLARELISGLLPDDVLRVPGYPEQDGGSIVVIRNDDVIASYAIVRFKTEQWSISAGRACSDTGLPFEGESVG